MPESRIFLANAAARAFLSDARVADECLILGGAGNVKAGDIVLVASEYYPSSSELVLEAKRNGGKVVHLADGMLEWRNTFEQPPRDVEGVGAPLWKPVLSDYFLALGDAQRRVVEAWGNQGKCQVLGSPRFDASTARYHDLEWNYTPSTPVRILVASARRFAFGPIDAAPAIQAFRDLRELFSRGRKALPFPFEVLWRVSEDLALELGLSEEEVNSGAGDLADVLGGIDAVITGPSSLMLEAMLQKVPVVCLDYSSSPHYVRAAWNIRGPGHIEPTLISLMVPERHRVEFQEIELADQLRLDGSATERLDIFLDELLMKGRVEGVGGPPDNVHRFQQIDPRDAEIAQLRLQIRMEREATATRLDRVRTLLRERQELLRKPLRTSIRLGVRKICGKLGI